MCSLYWVRNDRQGDVEMGEFETLELAKAGLEGARTEFHENLDPDETDPDDGDWFIYPEDGNSYRYRPHTGDWFEEECPCAK